MIRRISFNFPLEYDDEFVYVEGKRAQIIGNKTIESVDIIRHGEIIGEQITSGYVVFVYYKRKYKGYFRLENGRYSIYRTRKIS